MKEQAPKDESMQRFVRFFRTLAQLLRPLIRLIRLLTTLAIAIQVLLAILCQ